MTESQATDGAGSPDEANSVAPGARVSDSSDGTSQAGVAEWDPGRPLAAAASIGAGLAVCAGLPPWGWWPLTLLGLTAWIALLAGAGPRRRFWRSFGVGLGWFAPSLMWIASFSPPGYVIAALVFAALLGLAGLATPPGPSRILALPAALGVSELIRYHAPFGGVPLSMTSLTQADGPLASIARLGGPVLLTIAIALAAAGIEALVRRRWVWGGSLIGAVAVVAVIGVVAPSGNVVAPLSVAVVQGGGPQGTLALNTDPADVFARHLEASQLIEAGTVDLVVWPENVVNVDGQLADNPWDEVLADEARRLGAPLVVGVVEDVDIDHFANFSVVYEPDGTSGARYDKERRVPFGEYVPFRPVIEPIEEAIGGGLLPSRDQVPGTGTAVVEVPLADGTRVDAATVISWEIFFPRRVREGVSAGGEVVLNPTNGASYSLTLVQSQQVANSRLRAIESGRWVLQSAPTGFSAVVDPSGDVIQRTDVSEQDVLVATIERRDGSTLAQTTGLLLPSLLAAGLLVAAWALAQPGESAQRDRARSKAKQAS